MGSHHHQVTILVPADELDCIDQLENSFARSKMILTFYPGPMLPPRTDGSSLKQNVFIVTKQCLNTALQCLITYTNFQHAALRLPAPGHPSRVLLHRHRSRSVGDDAGRRQRRGVALQRHRSGNKRHEHSMVRVEGCGSTSYSR